VTTGEFRFYGALILRPVGRRWPGTASTGSM